MDHPLVVVRQPGRSALHLLVREALVVGRDCDGLVLTDPQISRRHLLLEPDGPTLMVTDLGSTNGTLLDGRRLGGTTALWAGQSVRLGDCSIEREGGPTVAAPCGIGAATVAALDREVRATSIDLVAAAVAVEPPRLVSDDAGTLTIVFCDIEDSTRRAVELGDVRWVDILGIHNTIVRRQVARHRGREVKAQGDGFMLSFPSARSAIDAMVEVQRALGTWARSRPTDAVRVRVGIHTGEVMVRDGGDLLGKHVDVAARVAGSARGGEILVSSLVREIVEARGDIAFDEPRSVELKGMDGTAVVHPVRWTPA